MFLIITVQLLNPLFCPMAGNDTSTGPSCSNNNDIFLRRTFSRNSPAHTRVDTVYTGSRRDVDAERENDDGSRSRKTPLNSPHVQGRTSPAEKMYSRPNSPRRRVISTPTRPSLPREDSMFRSQRSKARAFYRPRDRSTGDSPIPYMVSLHPYNWATSNNSSIHPTSSPEKGDVCDPEDFLPDDNPEESGVVYRKNRSFRRPTAKDYSLSVSGVGLEKPTLKSSLEGPRISYSTSPASAGKNSSENTADISESRDHGLLFDGDRNVGSKVSSRRRSKLPVSLHGNDDRTNSSSEARKVKGKKTRERSSSGSKSPRKSTHRKTSYCTLTNRGLLQSPDKKRVEKSVTFERHEDDFLQTRKFHRSGSRSPGSSPTRTRSTVDDLAGKPKPMYYKPPSEKRESVISGGESEEDETSLSSPNTSPRNNRFGFKQNSPASRPVDISLPLGSKEWSPLSSRLSRSLSGELCSPGGHEPYDLTRSRYELMELRDAFRERDFFPSNETFPNPAGTYSPDSLETSPVERRLYDAPFSLTSKSSNKPTAPDLSARKRKGASLISTNTSLPSTPGKSSESALPILDNPSQRTRQGSPRRKGSSSTTYSQAPTAVSLNEKKTHRSPTSRRRTTSPDPKDTRTEEWIKNTSRLGKTTALTRRPDTHKNANANRVPDSSSSFELSGVSPKDEDRLPFLRSLLALPDDSVLDKLLQEKRQLDQKYSNEKYRKSWSAPPSPWTATLSEGRSEQNSSSSEPRVGERLINSPGSSKESSKVSERAVVSTEHDAMPSEQLPPPITKLRQDTNRLPSPITKLRQDTDRLREETDKCRLCRQRRIRSEESMHEAFLSAYDHLGVPVGQGRSNVLRFHLTQPVTALPRDFSYLFVTCIAFLCVCVFFCFFSLMVVGGVGDGGMRGICFIINCPWDFNAYFCLFVCLFTNWLSV